MKIGWALQGPLEIHFKGPRDKVNVDKRTEKTKINITHYGDKERC